MSASSLNSAGLAALQAEVARAFAFFNARFWSGLLPTPVIAFFRQPPNGKKLGHYLADAWQAPDGTRRDELILYADLALERGMLEVLTTLLHEAVHVWQQHFAQPSGTGHHNAQWHAEAARVGLVTRGPTGVTEPGTSFLAALDDFAPRVEAIPFRVREGARQRGKLTKWICGCGFGVRVAIPRFDATCNRCHQQFRRA